MDPGPWPGQAAGAQAAGAARRFRRPGPGPVPARSRRGRCGLAPGDRYRSGPDVSGRRPCRGRLRPGCLPAARRTAHSRGTGDSSRHPSKTGRTPRNPGLGHRVAAPAAADAEHGIIVEHRPGIGDRQAADRGSGPRKTSRPSSPSASLSSARKTRRSTAVTQRQTSIEGSRRFRPILRINASGVGAPVIPLGASCEP